jgi:hypothetical protein
VEILVLTNRLFPATVETRRQQPSPTPWKVFEERLAIPSFLAKPPPANPPVKFLV